MIKLPKAPICGDLEIAYESLHSTMSIHNSTTLRCGMLFAVLLTWLYLSPATCMSRGPGRIRPRRDSIDSFAEDIKSEISGRVAKVYVREGQGIAPGDPLLELDSRLLEIELQRAKQSLISLEAEQKQLVSSRVLLEQAFQSTQEHLDAQLAAAEIRLSSKLQTQCCQIAIAKLALSAVDEQLTRAAPLLKVQAVSAEQYSLLKTNRDVARQELAIAKSPIDESEVKILDKSRAELVARHALEVDELSRSQLALSRQLNELRHKITAFEYQRQQQLVVRAACNAVVNQVQVRAGDVVSPQDVLLSLGPKVVEFEMLVDGRDIAEVRVGQKARVKLETADRFDAWLQGRVTYAASDSVPSAGAEQLSAAKYSVRIGQFENTSIRPTLGVTGQACIVTGSDSLFMQVVDWLLDKVSARHSSALS